MEFKEIMAELTKELGYNRVKIDEKSFELFKLLDQDRVRMEEEMELYDNHYYYYYYYYYYP